jgi:hypothetical protein
MMEYDDQCKMDPKIPGKARQGMAWQVNPRQGMLWHVIPRKSKEMKGNVRQGGTRHGMAWKIKER